MRLMVNRRSVFVSTGGRPLDRALPTIVLLHGAGSTHHFWVLQSRALAHDGWNVLAPDLPGHGWSEGPTHGSIGELAGWLVGLLDSAGCDKVVLAGHSMGALVALECAALHTKRVSGVVIIGSAAAIPVNSALIETATDEPDKAKELMVSWGYGAAAHLHENTWPGASHIFGGIAIMHGNKPQVLATDLKVCAAYKDGPDRARSLKVPSLCIFAERDRMVPMKSGLQLAGLIPGCDVVKVAASGHYLPTEKPREINAALRRFLVRLAKNPAAAGAPA